MEALRLPMKERAQLAERPLASLDEADPAELEKLWLDEAERRYESYKQGKMSARPMDEVLDEIDESLQ
jgi:putative addiction module component (TIGR02574 family)